MATNRIARHALLAGMTASLLAGCAATPRPGSSAGIGRGEGDAAGNDVVVTAQRAKEPARTAEGRPRHPDLMPLPPPPPPPVMVSPSAPVMAGSVADQSRMARERYAVAVPPVMVATDPALEGVTGKYFSDEREVTPSKLARDTELAERLYAVSCARTGVTPLPLRG